ncbi:hypothetical protein [Yersinia artesiana]|uniref:hypothetical protein n=1 Tax=Yersinia artesiana TaxID=2890315 RepID=UPI001D12E992|nr:hypothetical protein [Yersinia artesiana]
MRHQISAQTLLGGQVFANFMGQIRGAAASESLAEVITDAEQLEVVAAPGVIRLWW